MVEMKNSQRKGRTLHIGYKEMRNNKREKEVKIGKRGRRGKLKTDEKREEMKEWG
jgi:hypothetical protein